jgi:iron complex transport system permease protein
VTAARRPRALILGAMALALAAAMLAATALGAVAVPLPATLQVMARKLGLWTVAGLDPKWDAIIFLVRLPRVLGAALIGAALAVCGATLQAMLRNPMADPGILGVSAGAGFGAVLSIGLGLAAASPWFTPLMAAGGALAAAAIIVALSFRAGRMSVFTILLAGIAVSTFFGAGSSLVLSFASHDSVAQYLLWAMGTLYNLRWESLGLVTLPVLAGTAGLLPCARDLNLLALGEEEAQALGLDVARTRLALMALVSLTTAGAVSVAGPIGFVGLMVPHILRLLVGPDNRLLLPAAALGGALFLVLCDLAARMAPGGQEINVGIVTALLGAPYFLFLLVRSGARAGHP